MSPQQIAIEVRCRFCGRVLKLNPDSIEARQKGEDPHSQMRRHVDTCGDAFAWALKTAPLLIALRFESVTDNASWRDHLIRLVHYLWTQDDRLS
jgi:hypothetical protein